MRRQILITTFFLASLQLCATGLRAQDADCPFHKSHTGQAQSSPPATPANNQPQLGATPGSADIVQLTDDDIRSLLAGEGNGQARVAELNGFPGPRHVIDLANELELTPEQLQLANAAFDRMHKKAIGLGGEIVDLERNLDRAFSSGRISREEIGKLTSQIASLRGRLRAAHLEAHLEMKSVLTLEQVAKYDLLRGHEKRTGNPTS